MKRILTLTIILFSTSCLAFQHDVVKGQWAVYDSGLLSDSTYYFLNINNDYSGVLIRSLGHEPITSKFSSKDVIKQNGYIEIILSNNEKVVLSAWKLKSGSGKLTGQLFMYKEGGELFNMLYFPLKLLNDKHKLMGNDVIKDLSAKYR
jgi:hypothetical protein